MLKDFLGNEIHVGDKVFYSHTMGHGIERSIEKVLKITEKSIGVAGLWRDIKYIPAGNVVVVTSLVHEE